ncbi:hypothetical protein JDV02_002686 [Purpureocillium takamizusanense]|uniref:Peptidase M43 pregnancy-associated plasma-A domain-containing protein n=1 Tax=Purpureocillium takamizusanense TaxID=2060973 RepID=A0A9Q8QBI2_9HYPO|nr:uncharacterized protein JDV02_002686 [Purpureocillium takamizusanense]UNI16227.1 hypothetical protein JDV02_002686 [Purpureocillium takamizusanense]
MLIGKLSLIAGLATSAAAGAVPNVKADFSCGVHTPTRGQIEAHRKLDSLEKAARLNGVAERANINVDLYFHVVSASQSGANFLDDNVVKKQVQVLNEDYAPGGISFILRDTTRTVDRDWATNRNELAMKQKLHRGGPRDLNLYFLDRLEDDGYGICTFPERLSEPNGTTLDGCLVKASTAPGGAASRFNLGKTAVHEVGHWFGLLHTFESHSNGTKASGCKGPGDYVSDTPASDSPSRGCPTGRDSCPAPGLDPIHNYMDYSDDACYTEFSQGQIARMHSYWLNYRK